MATDHRKLVFFIIDGCSSYYLDMIPDLPGLQTIIKHGVKTKYAKPVFPSLSLPNYYSMFTGLYTEEHGMISNQVYDKDWKEKFHVSMKENRDRWYKETPEPLWIKSGRLGIRTSLYWPWFVNFSTPYSTGKNMHYGETYSTFVEHYRGDKIEFQTWTDAKLIEIVNRLKEPCSQFLVVYWGTLDDVCHKFGPRSPEAIAELKLADDFLLKLQEKLGTANLLPTVDILVAADHGQIDAPKENHIYMDGHAGGLIIKGDIEAWCEGEAYLLIYPAPGREDVVFETLTEAKIEHVSIVKNKDLPDRFRVKKAKRAPPIWIFAEPGYSLVDGSARAGSHNLGTHGYDNECESMRGICMGRGPGFERQPSVMTEKPIQTLDYYAIMCKLLGVQE